MADGQILIDTRIRTDEVKQDTANLKKQLESLADSASASAKKIDRSFDSLTIDDAADGLGESFEQEARKIEPIPEEIKRDFEGMGLENTADGLSEGFEAEADEIAGIPGKIEKSFSDIDLEDAAEGLAESFDEAWEDVRKESTKGADHVKDKLDDIGDEAKDTGDAIKRGLGEKLTGVFDGLSEKLGAGFAGGLLGGITAGLAEGALGLLEDAGRALVEFGAEAINLASDLQEVQNVVDVTFPGMSDKVNEFAQSAISSAGLSEAMAKKFTGTFGAMAKSFGFTEKEAYDMSTALTQLSGDVASFYNISQEEAFQKLTAVFTGETEALKELGVVMTDTALNAYAMEKGISKSTRAMSEQEKAALRYEFVMDKLSAASGDFVRTQDSWANQTKILALQWESFAASIGEGLIALLLPGVEFLTGTVMPALVWLGDVFANALNPTPAAEMAAQMEALGYSMDSVIINGYGVAVTYQDIQNAIEATNSAIATMQQEYDAARETARASLDTQIGLLDELTVKSDKSAKEIVANWEKQRVALIQYQENMQKAVQMGLDEALVQQLSDGSQQSMAILNELVNSTDVNVREINDAFRDVQEAKDTVSSTMADIQTGMSQKLEDMANNIRNEWGDMASTVGDSIAEMQAYINSLQGKDVYVNVITQSVSGPGLKTNGKGSGGFSQSSYGVNAASVPYLASGAVIPPNAPFAAVLGDQRNGTNLEAPEGLIRDIFREEMADMIGGMMAGFDAMVAEQQATRSVIQDIQIGDTTIGRAAARYERRQNLVRGGNTG